MAACRRSERFWRTQPNDPSPALPAAGPPVRPRARQFALPVPSVPKDVAVVKQRVPLQRRTPLRAQPRSKGNRAERSLIDLFRAHGWTGARRNFQSGGQGGGDILGGPAGCNHEAKHQERCSIWAWIAQSEADARPTDIPIVWFKRNRSNWYACLPAEELLALLALRERG